MRTELEGYKGNLRKFYAPVSESKFNADKLQLTDSSGSNLPFRINNLDGEPTIKHDVLSLGAMQDFTREHVKVWGYSDISTSTSAYQEFDLATLFSVSKYKVRLGSVKLFVNRVGQFNRPPWTSSSRVDYYFADNYRKLRLSKFNTYTTGFSSGDGIGYGITLKSGDEIMFKYKLQPIDLD